MSVLALHITYKSHLDQVLDPCIARWGCTLWRLGLGFCSLCAEPCWFQITVAAAKQCKKSLSCECFVDIYKTWIISYIPCNGRFSIFFVQNEGFENSWKILQLIIEHSHRHKQTKRCTRLQRQCDISPLSLHICMDEIQACDQQTQSWTVWHPLRCPRFPPIHSSITSKAPSAGGFYTNTCSLICNSQTARLHPRLRITNVDNSNGFCILGSKGQCLNVEV